jgi:hypothetical protein
VKVRRDAIAVMISLERGSVVVYPLIQRDVDAAVLASMLQRFAAMLIENPSEARRVCGCAR